MLTNTYQSPLLAINLYHDSLMNPSWSKEKKNALFTTLTKKGLDRLTDARIEHVICTSALAAFN